MKRGDEEALLLPLWPLCEGSSSRSVIHAAFFRLTIVLNETQLRLVVATHSMDDQTTN